jgi:hypothetical protein
LSPNKRQKLKTQNGEKPKEEKSINVGPKPITSSMKQVMQGDGQKNLEEHQILLIYILFINYLETSYKRQ